MIVPLLAGLLLVMGIGSAVWTWRSCGKYCGADWGSLWLNRLDGLNRLFCTRYHRANHVSIPLPERGGAIVVSNHISGLDPLLLLAASPRPLRFMIAREEYERFGLRWLFRAAGCIPVDRDVRPERGLREALRALRDGEVVALFPHGGIHVSESPATLKGGVVKLAQKSHSLVYPVHVDGVRGAGHTLLAVVMRSRVQLRMFPPLSCASVDHPECLQKLSKLLHKKLWGAQ